MKRLTIVALLAAGLPLGAHAQPALGAHAELPFGAHAQPLIAPTRLDAPVPVQRGVDRQFGLPKFGLPGQTTLRHDTTMPPWEIAPGMDQTPGQATAIHRDGRGSADFFKQDAAGAAPADPREDAPDFFRGNADLTLPRDATPRDARPRGSLLDEDQRAGATPVDQGLRAMPDFLTADGALPPEPGPARADYGNGGNEPAARQ